MTEQTVTTDVLIIGAGIAGLWLHHRLNSMGFHAVLLENQTIGHAQTLSSQGIIHGGVKYALTGILSNASTAISEMPKRWHHCLAGSGEVDLTQAKLLTDQQLLWSKDQLSAKMLSFFASKALSSRIQAVSKQQRPALFQHPNFQGSLYRLQEPVLDIASVLTTLAAPYHHRISKIPNDAIFYWKKNSEQYQSLTINHTLTFKAQHYVLTAGEGNQALLDQLALNKPKMQKRPLHMVLCKAKDKQQPLPTLYAHNLGSSSKPIATITSHLTADNNTAWYIGGNIAEQGVGKHFTDITREAQVLLRNILPWVNLPELDWATHTINRAEAKQSALSRPDSAFVKSQHNLHIAWPTKLALAPALADSIIKQLHVGQLTANQHRNSIDLPPAQIGTPLWDHIFK